MVYALSHVHRVVSRSLGVAMVALAAMTGSAQDIPPERAAMLEAIRASVRDSAGYTGRDELSERVMQAMAETPREAFVPQAYQHLAHRNTPLPIAAEQTISQPLIVALMTELLDPQPGDVVLEVGTGSGYQAAVLSLLVKHVYSIEIVIIPISYSRRVDTNWPNSRMVEIEGTGHFRILRDERVHQYILDFLNK